jgi:methyltransferase (TIGR00027 family)
MGANLKPVSKTAYYCCGVRALDARAPHSVCGDQYAERFMTSEAWAFFERFRGLKAANATNIARHRMIDDLLRARLARRPDTGVVIIGAGFDARAFRLRGGHWVELDEPALIALKEVHLPAHAAPNPLTRVAIAFDREPLEEALRGFRLLTEPMIVLEGVLPYLTAAEVEKLAQTILSTFTHPTLVCDLTTPAFARSYGRRIGKRLRELGAQYGRLEREPAGIIEGAGFRMSSRESIAACAAALGILGIPRWLLATVLRSLRDGYTVATFESAPRPGAGAPAP